MPASASVLHEPASGSLFQKDAQIELGGKKLENSADDVGLSLLDSQSCYNFNLTIIYVLKFQEPLSVSGSGTVVLRTPRETQMHTAFNNQSSKV